jgi:hypothetical protein
MFTAHAIEAKRNTVTNDLIHLASEAQKYYKTPSSMGGGSQKFIGWEIPYKLKTNADGSFLVSQAIEEQKVILVGTGNEVVTGNDSVKVKITILPSDFSVTIIN